jgi:hypothetical protein
MSKHFITNKDLTVQDVFRYSFTPGELICCETESGEYKYFLAGLNGDFIRLDTICKTLGEDKND